MKRLLPLLTTAALLMSGCSGEQEPRVQTAEVGRTTVAETVDAPGTVGARATASIAAPTDARVEQVLVADGATVKAGAVLARLSSPAAQERLRQARAAQAAASSAAVRVPRAELGPLQDAVDAAAAASFAAGRAAAEQVEDPGRRRAALAQVDQAERRYRATATAARATIAQVESGAQSLEDALAAVAGTQRAQADAAVRAAKAVVDALVVRAPIGGVVTLGGTAAAATPAGADLAALLDGLPAGVQERAGAALGARGSEPATTSAGLPVGAQVAAGTPLLTVTDLGGLTVTAEVDETDVLLVRTGQQATVELDAVPGASYPATVAAVDVAPTSSAGGGVTYRVRLSLAAGTTSDAAPAPRPRPGMSAIVDLEVRTATSVLAVPSAAVVRDGDRDAVFVVEDGRAQRVEVVIGAQGSELVEVRRGLSGGEQVVIRDADRLGDGQAVRT
ncbi:MAG: efflux RND transporter periplasmic adaptor subunit [Mycobacteriales bacterium]